eukprot:m.326201 g.326201  ORF g.326201 m.326201 type:complete len:193 (-) comp55569_c0_seq25:71-649(-)
MLETRLDEQSVQINKLTEQIDTLTANSAKLARESDDKASRLQKQLDASRSVRSSLREEAEIRKAYSALILRCLISAVRDLCFGGEIPYPEDLAQALHCSKNSAALFHAWLLTTKSAGVDLAHVLFKRPDPSSRGVLLLFLADTQSLLGELTLDQNSHVNSQRLVQILRDAALFPQDSETSSLARLRDLGFTI